LPNIILFARILGASQHSTRLSIMESVCLFVNRLIVLHIAVVNSEN